MGMFLKQSTAIDISVGPFLDESDGKTAETTLTITQPDIRLKKNGGAWAQKNAAQTLSHEENGWYEIALDTTDTGTVGNLLVAIHEAGALPVWREFQVLPANVYDSLIGGTDKLQVHADEITNGLITAAAIATGAIDADAIADNAIDAGAIAADAITAAKVAPDVHAEMADAVWDESIVGHNTGLPAMASYVESANNEAAGANTRATDLQARVPAALIGGKIDANLNAAGLDADAVTEIQAGLSSEAQVDALVLRLIDIEADTQDIQSTVNDIEADIAALSIPDVDAIADAVWDEPAAEHVGAGSTGESLAGIESALGDINTLLADLDTSLQNVINVTGPVTDGLTTALGTTSTIIDSARTEADDFWIGMKIRIRSGANANLERIISDFDATTDTITVAPPFPNVVGTPIAYRIIGEANPVPAEVLVPTANENADALLDRAGAVDGYTPREILRLKAAAMGGKSSGDETNDVIRAVDDSKDRITTEIDENGHRTTVTLDLT